MTNKDQLREALKEFKDLRQDCVGELHNQDKIVYEAAQAYLDSVEVLGEVYAALEIGLCYTALTANGDGKMPITTNRAKSDTAIIEGAMRKIAIITKIKERV